MATEWRYLMLIVALFIIPRVLQRYKIPSAITSFLAGAVCSFFLPTFQTDPVIQLFSMLGIVSLFLFAGLELPLNEVGSGGVALVRHLSILTIVFIGVSWACLFTFGLETRAGYLMSLALITPSTGFILASIDSFHMNPRERFWVKSTAVAAEILALGGLFMILQSTSWLKFISALIILAALVTMVPLILRTFAKLVLPYAPRSEFSFLLMVALLCAAATKLLGVYYLVGAFVVGVAAQRFREIVPELGSKRMLDAIELFASFFIPFYFFRAGLQMSGEVLSLQAAAVSFVLILVILPLRLGWMTLDRWAAFKEPFQHGVRIASCLLPTLVFTLVIAEILRDRYSVDDSVIGGLVIYALINTLVPAFVFRAPLPEYTAPHVDSAKTQ